MVAQIIPWVGWTRADLAKRSWLPMGRGEVSVAAEPAEDHGGVIVAAEDRGRRSLGISGKGRSALENAYVASRMREARATTQIRRYRVIMQRTSRNCPIHSKRIRFT